VNAADRPTRLVFVDRLVNGQTVIHRCRGDADFCPLKVEHPPGEHYLTILDSRDTPETRMMIVVDSATGEQCTIARSLTEALRIYADDGQAKP
jgi:hypothetical protein